MNMLESLLTIALVKSASLSIHKIQNLVVIVISSSIRAEDTGMLLFAFHDVFISHLLWPSGCSVSMRMEWES